MTYPRALIVAAILSIASQATAQTPKLGDLIQPFDPPTLEELNKIAKWEDRPVVDSLKLLSEKQAKEKPPGTVAQALAAKNTSPQANRAILSVLGRLPAKDSRRELGRRVEAAHQFRREEHQPAAGQLGFGSSTSTASPALACSASTGSSIRSPSSDTVVSWQSSKDRLYDKVVMRDDLTWSDGKPITAHDVVFSFK